jgi:hypothetical protein
MHMSANRPNRRQCWAPLLLALPLACGTSSKGTPEVPVEDLPAYDATAVRIFDDSIAPEVFGLQVDRTDLEKDPRFKQRAEEADHVLHVKLRTIREERFEDALRYRIVVQPLGEPLFGGPVAGELELSVGRASPSLSMLRSMSLEAVGAKFLLLLKRYRLKDEPVLHFRGEPESPAIIEAIRRVRSPAP